MFKESTGVFLYNRHFVLLFCFRVARVASYLMLYNCLPVIVLFYAA